MAASDDFLFTTCQVGAERALKAEFARRWPQLSAAFTRPGFVTFKAKSDGLNVEQVSTSIFARACAASLGKVTGDSAEAMAAAAWKLIGERPVTGLHVWRRDLASPGERDYEPGITPKDVSIAKLIRRQRPDCPLETWVHPGQLVLDCVVVEPSEWWIGWHQAAAPHTCWPGGFCGAKLPPNAVSRTYLKMEEALRWSQFPLKAGQRCAEIGAAPGGTCQALLAHGLEVIGVDPADMHPDVAAHPDFTHVKKRGVDVRRREFRKIKWLAVDMNVAPAYTLDTAEAIVTHPEVNIRGLLLTLKLSDWDLAEHVPDYLFRIRTWGYKQILARQLQHNRQEICVAALKAKPAAS